MQLTERDRDILRHVRRHRFLRSSHLAALIGGRTQHLLRRLRLLYHHGYLERPRAQIDYYHRGGSRCLAYGLGKQSAALLQLERSSSDWSAKNDGVGRSFLEHALMVSDVMVSLEVACRQNGRVRLLIGEDIPMPAETRIQSEPFQWRVTLASRTKLGVIPDRVFALEFLDQPQGRNRVLCFLEADRATMPIARRTLTRSSFQRKLLAYEATWTQGLQQTRFGFQRFRVVTVTTSTARVASLVEASRQLSRGHGLFLFTDLATLTSHDDMLTLPFQSGRAGQTTTLLD
jgi:DNA-binding Lrp family transcriptional regulator